MKTNFRLRLKAINISHFGESTLKLSFKMLPRKALLQKSRSGNSLDPFLTNKNCHTQNDTMLIDNIRAIVEEHDLVETFNNH